MGQEWHLAPSLLLLLLLLLVTGKATANGGDAVQEIVVDDEHVNVSYDMALTPKGALRLAVLPVNWRLRVVLDSVRVCPEVCDVASHPPSDTEFLLQNGVLVDVPGSRIRARKLSPRSISMDGSGLLAVGEIEITFHLLDTRARVVGPRSISRTFTLETETLRGDAQETVMELGRFVENAGRSAIHLPWYVIAGLAVVALGALLGLINVVRVRARRAFRLPMYRRTKISVGNRVYQPMFDAHTIIRIREHDEIAQNIGLIKKSVYAN